MSASLADLRRKIKSITGTKKLTQAMQMVAASKMQKSIDKAQNSRDYATLAQKIIDNIGQTTDIANHPLLNINKSETIALVLITSNKGMCGGLNAQVIRKITTFIKTNKDKKIEIITIGNKGKTYIARYYSSLLVADFPAPDRLVEFSDITSVGKLIVDGYLENKYSKIIFVYNHFVSTLSQIATEKQLLPITEKINTEKTDIKNNTEYKYEPDAKSILNVLIPSIIKTQIYQIMLESSASEHSARMIAMKNATDNASDLIDDLQLTYNSLRQAAITKEINEIAAGAEALKK